LGKGIRYSHVESVLKEYYAKRGGKVLEIGAGGATYKDIFSDYLGTDLPGNPYSQKGDLDVYCDAQYLPFKENTFDMAFTVAALYQIPVTDLVLAEINRILKVDGYFLIFDYNKKTTRRLKATENEGNNCNHVWSPWELKRIINKAGFQAQIITSYINNKADKGIKPIIMRTVPVSISYLIRNLLYEGWNIIAATKKEQV